jgi:hypothetical protein
MEEEKVKEEVINVLGESAAEELSEVIDYMCSILVDMALSEYDVIESVVPLIADLGYYSFYFQHHYEIYDMIY